MPESLHTLETKLAVCRKRILDLTFQRQKIVSALDLELDVEWRRKQDLLKAIGAAKGNLKDDAAA